MVFLLQVSQESLKSNAQNSSLGCASECEGPPGPQLPHLRNGTCLCVCVRHSHQLHRGGGHSGVRIPWQVWGVHPLPMAGEPVGTDASDSIIWGIRLPLLMDILEMRFRAPEPQLATAEASARCHCHCCLRAELGREQSGRLVLRPW